MIEKIFYHFKPTNNNNNNICDDDFVLSQNATIPNETKKYLKNFQLSAVKFLYKNFESHKACILNDETGLGKTVSVAVFLNVILANRLEKRKCLIICKNEERIINWKFHLDILTDLTFKVVFNDNEIDENIVYLTKWESLRSSASLSNYKFDCIIVDNRENLMANKICLAYLLRNYENKISLVIGNQDLTIDLKEFHSTLRLCGRLEPKYKDFKVFENNFELPLVTGSSSDNQKILESYFLRREKVLNYCKEFCLRRFRHEFESQLPLVAANVYRLNLKKWEDAPIISKIKPVQLNLFAVPQRNNFADRDTEELHTSYMNGETEINQNGNDLSSFFSRKEEDEFNNEVCRITTTITENCVEQSTEVMSPLIFIPDDSSESVCECDKVENIVSSTTKELIHPTAIHIDSTKNATAHKGKKGKSNTKDTSDSPLSDDQPQFVRATRLNPRTKQEKDSKAGYKKLTIQRISTRCQDIITRSKAHKNKYLTLSIENSIERSKREINQICKTKKKNQNIKSLKKPIKKGMPNTSAQKILNKRRKASSKRINDASSETSNSEDSNFSLPIDDSNEPVQSSTDSLAANLSKRKTSKNALYNTKSPMSGIDNLDLHSDAVHVIESTPELIVLTSSTDCSNLSEKKPKNAKLAKKVTLNSKPNYTKQNNKLISSSPDIFGSAIEESLNLLCSQPKGAEHNLYHRQGLPFKNGKEKSKSNVKEKRFEVASSNDCEIVESTEKHVPRKRAINPPSAEQLNKITKYLTAAQDQLGHESDKDIVSSSSQSLVASPLLRYPKTPKKRISKSNKDSATKASPHIKAICSNAVTPTKTPTALTKWLMKSNERTVSEGVSSANIKSDKISKSVRETRSVSVRKRRRLDVLFKD